MRVTIAVGLCGPMEAHARFTQQPRLLRTNESNTNICQSRPTIGSQVPKVRQHFATFAASLVKPAAAKVHDEWRGYPNARTHWPKARPSSPSTLVHPTKVGWDSRPEDGHLGKLLRATLVNLLSLFCWWEPEVLQEARRRFERICADPGDVGALPTEYKVLLWDWGCWQGVRLSA